ncbi:MAG: glycosyltransferase family 2 protein [Acidimicrobiia bacterium]
MSSQADRPQRVLVVTPAFNEQAMVGEVVREIRTSLPTAAVVVVDDGSTDSTARRAREAGALVLSLPFNLGVGGAMRVGYRFALRRGYDAVVQVDADGQHDPREIPRLLAGLEGSDIVIGARFAGKGTHDVPGLRRWMMKRLARLVSRVAGVALTDVTSGFRAAGPQAIRVFSRTYPAEYLGDTVESLVIASKHGLIISQVPVAMRERLGGEPSQTSIRASIYALRAVAVILLSRIQTWPSPRQNPDPETAKSYGGQT